MSRKTKKVRDAIIMVLGLVPCLAAFILLPPEFYIIGLIILILVNALLLAFLIPSAIALQQQQDRIPTVICVVHDADQ